MERGFKSRCEAMAKSLRVELGVQPADPLKASQLASYLCVPVWSVAAIGLADGDLHQLLEVDPDSWSAITVSASGREAIIVNPNHRRGRHSSDVMHELAHLLLGHEASRMLIMADGDLALRGYDPSSEEEATWLAAALLLPRVALVEIKKQSMPHRVACNQYEVSEQLLNFRLQVTGVERQIGRGKPGAVSGR